VTCLAAALVCLAAPSYAQKPRPTTTEPDADGDGVPDRLDRCAGTPRGQRVTREGCPIRLLLPGQRVQPAAASSDTARTGKHRPTPTLVGRPVADSARGSSPAAGVPLTQQAAAAPAGNANAFSAGLAVQPFAGEEAARDGYLRRFTTLLDSTIASLAAAFRNTAGQPMSGATAPTSLSQRERERWGHCRDLHWDLQSYVAAMHDLVANDNVPDSPVAQRAAAALDSALGAVDATAECDNVASMIAAPGRWTPWESQYTASAHRFYDGWYAQMRDVADRNRAFIMALNTVLPAEHRIPVPPAMPRTPPYAGAGPR